MWLHISFTHTISSASINTIAPATNIVSTLHQMQLVRIAIMRFRLNTDLSTGTGSQATSTHMSDRIQSDFRGLLREIRLYILDSSVLSNVNASSGTGSPAQRVSWPFHSLSLYRHLPLSSNPCTRASELANMNGSIVSPSPPTRIFTNGFILSDSSVIFVGAGHSCMSEHLRQEFLSRHKRTLLQRVLRRFVSFSCFYLFHGCDGSVLARVRWRYGLS